jgi:signal peptidase I
MMDDQASSSAPTIDPDAPTQAPGHFGDPLIGSRSTDMFEIGEAPVLDDGGHGNIDDHDGGGSGGGGGDGEGDEGAGEGGPPAKKPRISKSVREWGLVVIIAIAAAALMKLFVVQMFYVSGTSMINTLHDYDRVLVNKLSYDLHDPNRGDVVVLEERQGLSQRDLIKRVIGLPGETIEMDHCVVTINGKVLVEPYLDPNIVTPNNCGPDIPEQIVKDHHVFVMGDNRPGSGDSRGTLGQVDFNQIVGRAFVVIWPKSDWQWL